MILPILCVLTLLLCACLTLTMASCLSPVDPTPHASLKDWAKFSSGSSANQKFSLAPLAPISFD